MSARRERSEWISKVEGMLEHLDGPEEPEAGALEAQKPAWARKVAVMSQESVWGPLPMNRAWSDAKRLGCEVGREFVMRQWVLEQFASGNSADLETIVREG